MFIVLGLPGPTGPTYSSPQHLWQLNSTLGFVPHGDPLSVIITYGFPGPICQFGFLIRGESYEGQPYAKSTIAFLLCLAASLFLLSPDVKAQGPENNATVTSGDVGPSADDSGSSITRCPHQFSQMVLSRCSPAGPAIGALPPRIAHTIGDKLWVDQNSRAELQAGQAALHLGSMTAISFLNLDQNITQIRSRRQAQPSPYVNPQGDNYEVDTPICLYRFARQATSASTSTRRRLYQRYRDPRPG